MIALILSLWLTEVQAITKVPIIFIEALAPRDSTSSEKFKKDFEGAITTGKSLIEADLRKCGYELETSTQFYDASEALQAKELAEKSSKDTWLFVGPRRSNHYIAMVKGAESTASVSLMAGSSEVEHLGSLHTTLSPFNQQMASVAATEAARRTRKNKSYISIVSSDCLSCVDFAESFNKSAKLLGLKQVEQIKISGEEPDVSSYVEKIRSLSAGFILLPNFSKASVKVMNTLDTSFNGFYVGADGWGDSKFGFVQKGAQSDATSGFTVRGFPPVKEGLRQFYVGHKVLSGSKAATLPEGGPAMAALKILDWTKILLCAQKPKSKESFTSEFKKRSTGLNAPWGVSIYNLKSGEIIYDRRTKK